VACPIGDEAAHGGELLLVPAVINLVPGLVERWEESGPVGTRRDGIRERERPR
jgi:hypothetical protein